MLMGVERLVDLVGPSCDGASSTTAADVSDAVFRGDAEALRAFDGHFAAVRRDGATVRLARTLGAPIRYFVAKLFHGPYLVVSDRIDSLYEWCCRERIGWQFDPLYTRMIPAHHLVEIEQIGCPDPNPRYTRFFDGAYRPTNATSSELGESYARAALAAIRSWLLPISPVEPVALAFSGGIDSGAVLLLARAAMAELGRSPDLIRPFTLDLGAGADARQAATFLEQTGLLHTWERVDLPKARPDIEHAISVIEDYHPLDVECAAAALLLLAEVRRRHPQLRYLLDGDGGDENLKSYPVEDSDLTLDSVLRNPLLYQEGWGIDAMKHSLTYSGGLSRGYVRTYAPAKLHGFQAFSPFTTRAVIARAQTVPFQSLAGGSLDRLYSLKAEIVAPGVEAVTGIPMPVFSKRRFQEGAGGEIYRQWRVGKAQCRRIFLRQWEQRLSTAWESPELSDKTRSNLGAV